MAKNPNPGIHRLCGEEFCSEYVRSDAETVVLVARRKDSEQGPGREEIYYILHTHSSTDQMNQSHRVTESQTD